MKIPSFVIFELFQRAIPQKKAFFTYISIPQRKSMIYLKEIEKKSIFSDFFVKIDSDHLFLFAYFSNMCQRISKLSLPVPWKGFEIKSHQVRAHYLKPLRNGRQISPVVASPATPRSC